MTSLFLDPTDRIPCESLDCYDILPNLKALRCHILIHIIGDSVDRMYVIYGPPSFVVSHFMCRRLCTTEHGDALGIENGQKKRLSKHQRALKSTYNVDISFLRIST